MNNQSKKYLATTEQLNVLLGVVSEMKIKEGMGAYQVIQQILRQPYIQPAPEPEPPKVEEVVEEEPKPVKPKKKIQKRKSLNEKQGS